MRPLTAGRRLCVHCLYALMVPATLVDAVRTSEAQDDPPGLRMITPGLPMVDAVRRARDDGYRIDINNQTDVGVYADTIFHGDSVCTAHFWISVEQARNPKSHLW